MHTAMVMPMHTAMAMATVSATETVKMAWFTFSRHVVEAQLCAGGLKPIMDVAEDHIWIDYADQNDEQDSNF